MILLNSNLNAFIAVVENSTVSAAAKKLGLTQTGATQRIKALEKDLGTSLFLRSRSGMKLTPEGATLLRHCVQVRELECRMNSEMQKSGVEHEVDITITGPSGLMARRIIPQCAKVCEVWPRLNFRFISEAHSDRIRLLKSGIADFAIVLPHDVKNEMDSKVIGGNDMVLVATGRWKDRPLDDILQLERMILYNSKDLMGLDYLKEFNLLDRLKRPRILANDNEMLVSLVQLGLGFALVPIEMAQPFIEQKSMIALNEGKSMKIPFALTWYPRSEMPGYFKDLIKAIK